MTIKEEKYQKALDAMLYLGLSVAYTYSCDEAEDVSICDIHLKQYWMMLNDWIDDDKLELDSFPKKISKKIKEIYEKKGYDGTRVNELLKDCSDYPAMPDLSS